MEDAATEPVVLGHGLGPHRVQPALAIERQADPVADGAGPIDDVDAPAALVEDGAGQDV
jgi:hypothetical protein